MPAPSAPEPHDLPPGDASTEVGTEPLASMSPPTGAAEDTTSTGDLASIPAFLRVRAAASAGPQRAIVQRPEPAMVDVVSLPMLGIAPRRLVLVGAVIVLAWLLLSFGRQVTAASAASLRADELRATNTALAAEVDALEQELQTIQDQRYIDQAARGYRLGTPEEVPFALEHGAPPLAADAPGSASVRIGAEVEVRSPLEHWLDVLFGPGG